MNEEKEQEVRIITEYNKGVRCGHCGDRGKVGETWIVPGRFWIGDMAICYGHKKCVEEAINIALLKQPECETCGGTKIVKCTMPHDRAYWGDVKDCPDCQKPPASELHPNKKGREDCEDCPYPERHCSECINGDNRAKVSQAFESNEKPPASEEDLKLCVTCPIFNEKDALQAHLDKAEAALKEYRSAFGNQGLLQKAELRIKELEALRDTVQISCNPPKDCNDPVVLKTYMKGCFDEAMEL